MGIVLSKSEKATHMWAQVLNLVFDNTKIQVLSGTKFCNCTCVYVALSDLDKMGQVQLIGCKKGGGGKEKQALLENHW